MKKEAVAGCKCLELVSAALTQEYQFPFSMPVLDLVIAIFVAMVTGHVTLKVCG